MIDKVARPRLGLPLWILQLALGVGASFFVWFRAISIPRCDQACDFALLQGTSTTFALGCAVVIAGTGLWQLAMKDRSWSWWIPLGGSALILIGALVANLLSNRALLF